MAEEPDWKSLLKNLMIYPGINKFVFDGIKLEAPKWTLKRKYCTISFDLFPIEPHLDYDSNLDQVIGFVSLPGQTGKPNFATHALMFVVNCAVFRWTQHIAVYFCESKIPIEQMKLVLEEVVAAVLDTGLIPIALIATQRVSFQMAIRDFQREHARQQIIQKKSAALKGLCINCIRMIEEKQGKTLESQTVWNTVEVLVFFDKLFDSVNGLRPRLFKSRSTGRIKRLRTAITEESHHHEFWNKAIKQLAKIKFLSKNGKKASTVTIKNWIITIQSFQDVYKFLTEKNVKSVKPRYFSLETLEQFVSKVKAHNTKKQLTCSNVLKSFKTFLVLEPNDESDADSDDSHDTFASFENFMRNNIPNYDNIDIFAL